jgi:hypothetical protein
MDQKRCRREQKQSNDCLGQKEVTIDYTTKPIVEEEMVQVTDNRRNNAKIWGTAKLLFHPTSPEACLPWF